MIARKPRVTADEPQGDQDQPESCWTLGTVSCTYPVSPARPKWVGQCRPRADDRSAQSIRYRSWSALTYNAGSRSTDRSFPLGDILPPFGERKQTSWCPIGNAYTDSEKLLTENRQRRFKQWPGLASSPAIGETIASMMRALLRGLALAHVSGAASP